MISRDQRNSALDRLYAFFFLRDKSSWIQGALATDDLGNEVPLKDATCFCLVGGIALLLSHKYDYPLEKHVASALAWAINPLGLDIVGTCLTDWNDAPGRTYREVLALIACAKDAPL